MICPKGTNNIESVTLSFKSDAQAKDILAWLDNYSIEVVVNDVVIAKSSLIILPTFSLDEGYISLMYELKRPVREGDRIITTLKKTSDLPVISPGITITAALTLSGSIDLERKEGQD
jgi:hypothetical protein